MERSDYTRREQHVRRIYRRRTWLINHLLVFAAVISALWLHYLSFALRAETFHINVLMDRVIVTLVWFTLLVVHYINARQAAVLEREIDQLARQEGDADIKPKRGEIDALARLADADDDEYLPLDALLLKAADDQDAASR